MKILNYKDVEPEENLEDASGIKMRWLISKEMGANNFAMRFIEIEPKGFSPLHDHPWEHEIFVLEGEGLTTNGKDEKKIKEGDFIFIPPNETHQTKNIGINTLKLLCMIPYEKTT
jgi:quercetin dioxygenase-like cupin family protein